MENKELIDFETAIDYALLALHTLKNSSTEITAKELKKEMSMLYERFESKEVKRLVNTIKKGKKRWIISNYSKQIL